MEPMQLERLQADVRTFDGHYTGLILVGPGGLGKFYTLQAF